MASELRWRRRACRAQRYAEPGESRALRFDLRSRDFAYYDERLHDWVVDSGRFDILVGTRRR